MSDEAKVLLAVAAAGVAGYIIWRILTGQKLLPGAPEERVAVGKIASVEYSAV